MKHTLIILITIFISFAAKSQEYIYGYDNAGNRISRMAIILNSTPQNPPDSSDNQTANYESEDADEPVQYESVLDDQVITVYPNPTTGELKINISDFEEGTKGSIMITDMQGKLIYQSDNINGNNIVNLSNAASGQYLMRIAVNNKNHEWFVMKE